MPEFALFKITFNKNNHCFTYLFNAAQSLDLPLLIHFCFL